MSDKTDRSVKEFASELARNIRDQVDVKVSNRDRFPEHGMLQMRNCFPFVGAFFNTKLNAEFIIQVSSPNEAKLDISVYGEWATRSDVRNKLVKELKARLAELMPEWKQSIPTADWPRYKTDFAPVFTCCLMVLRKEEEQPIEHPKTRTVPDLQERYAGALADNRLGNSVSHV